MAEVTLTIHGQNYGIACDDGQEGRVKELGRYVDSRLREIASAGAATTESHLLVLAGLVLADEIYELREALETARNTPPLTAQPPQAPIVTNGAGAGLSSQDEQAAVEMIEQLAARINSVTGRLANAA
ncbi:MAG: cell division protein ZapA [Rhodospirillales bacterium]|nr:cell division protein ZapA [Rhodospirillales bacterium]